MSETSNLILPGKFVVWFHSITDNSWEASSYVNLCDGLPDKSVGTADDLLKVYAGYQKNVTAGMFFLMRDGIFPKWEDPGNINGGYWSFKVPKKMANEVWLQLTSAFIGNTLLNDTEKSNKITGISVSPKISNCVMKIWNNDKSFCGKNVFTKQIRYLEPEALMYKPNKN
jgi:hypothetical protein